jgi:hypothetical protein
MALHRLKIRLSSVRQLFNSLDPAPFHEKDLDRDAEEYIAGWANEFPRGSTFELDLILPQEELAAADRNDVGRAIQNYFSYRAQETWRQMRSHLREGRFALAVGLLFLVACVIVRQLVPIVVAQEVALRALQEGLLILGWVAMWRPLEIFLYDWWPIRHRARLYESLSRMPVKVQSIDKANRE